MMDERLLSSERGWTLRNVDSPQIMIYSFACTSHPACKQVTHSVGADDSETLLRAAPALDGGKCAANIVAVLAQLPR